MKQVKIGACDAKTRLSPYQRKVRAGERFTITQRGEAIAELVPCGVTHQHARREAARSLLAFVRASPVTASVDVKALIERGRD